MFPFEETLFLCIPEITNFKLLLLKSKNPNKKTGLHYLAIFEAGFNYLFDSYLKFSMYVIVLSKRKINRCCGNDINNAKNKKTVQFINCH